MKTKTLILVPLLICFLLGAGVFAASNILNQFSFKNNDATCSGTTCIDNDTWKLAVDNILIFDSDRDSYQDKSYRGLLQGTITSDLFGTFTIESEDAGDPGLILIDKEYNGKCGDNQHTYSVSGSIISDGFGILQVDESRSLFCPKSLQTFVVFHSDILPKKILYNLGLDPSEEENLETSPIKVTFNGATTANIFEKQQVLILGIANLKGDTGELFNESGNTNINEINSSKEILPILREEIEKNIFRLTRNAPSTTKQDCTNKLIRSSGFDANKAMVHLDNEDFFYYHFDCSNSTLTADTNEGHIVELRGNNSKFSEDNPTGYQMEIDGKKTLIVEGANVYINADLYNADDKTSLLTIIAKRDSNNRGGNIYIDPDVTNIDAALIADGSLLSYRKGLGVLNRNTDNDDGLLARQLYIFGTIFTRNTIGSEQIPYGTDIYILKQKKSYDTKEENIYDLANMRGFQTQYADPSTAEADCGGLKTDDTRNWYWTAGYIEANDKLEKTKTYAWAGKRKCFNNEINTEIADANADAKGVENLRTTDKANALIIEYNPLLQSDAPFIFEKN